MNLGHLISDGRSHEQNRIRELRSYNILDTRPEEPFETIVWLASRMFGTPISFIAFVDESRQWVKACIGLQCPNIPREDALCTHTIINGSVLVIEDASDDERFKTSLLVCRSPQIKFYAAACLSTPNGYNIGTIGVAAYEKGSMDAVGRKILMSLALLSTRELELRRLNERLRSEARQHEVDRKEIDRARFELDCARRAVLLERAAQLQAPTPQMGSFVRSFM